MSVDAQVHIEGAFCEMSIEAPSPGIVVLTISGHDIGEFGAVPMSRLEKYLSETRPVQLFIDARHTKGASIAVSSDWALWLGRQQAQFERINMLVGSRLIQVTAAFVRRFSGLEGKMRIYTNDASFDAALGLALAAT